MDEKQASPRIMRRSGGWFVEWDSHDIGGPSGPWLTEECATLAREEKYSEAHVLERKIRTGK